MADMQSVYNLVLSAQDKASAVMQKIAVEAKKTGDSANQAAKALNFLKNLQIAEYAMQAAAKFAAMAKATIDIADEMGKLSDKTGLTVEQLSMLRELAKYNGVDIEKFAASVAKMNIRAAESPADFERLGIAVKDAQGNIRPTIDLLGDVAEKIKGTKSPAQQAAIAVGIFGKAGVDLIPTLKQGRDGIAAVEEETKKLGAVMSKDLSNAAAEFNDNLQRVAMASQGVTNAILSDLLPSTNLLLNMFVEYKKGAAEGIDTNGKFQKSVVDLAEEPALQSIIVTLATIANVLEGVKDAGATAFDFVSTAIAGLGMLLETASTQLNAFVKGSYQEVVDAGKAFKTQHEALYNDFTERLAARGQTKKLGDKIMDAYESALNRVRVAQQKATAQEEATTKGVAISTKATWDAMWNAQRGAMVRTAETAKDAVEKAKAAVSLLKAVRNEFNDLFERLSKGNALQAIDKQLDRIQKKYDNAKKKDDYLRGRAEDQAMRGLSNERDGYADAVEAAKTKLEAAQRELEKRDSRSNELEVEAAQRALTAAQDKLKASESNLATQQKSLEATREERAHQEKMAEFARQGQEAEASTLQKYESQLAIQKQIEEITARIAENKKMKRGNEEEIAAMRDIGKTLDENRANGYNLLSKESAINFAQQLKEIGQQAAAADAAMYEAKADAALEAHKNAVQGIQDQLSKVDLNLSPESVQKAADEAFKKISEALQNIQANIQVNADLRAESSGGGEPKKFATGGYVRGPGSGTSDSIPARLSNGEFVINAASTSRHRQVLEAINSGAGVHQLAGLVTGSANASAEPAGGYLRIDLNSSAGTFSMGPGTSQAELEKYLRRAGLKR